MKSAFLYSIKYKIDKIYIFILYKIQNSGNTHFFEMRICKWLGTCESQMEHDTRLLGKIRHRVSRQFSILNLAF